MLWGVLITYCRAFLFWTAQKPSQQSSWWWWRCPHSSQSSSLDVWDRSHRFCLQGSLISNCRAWHSSPECVVFWSASWVRLYWQTALWCSCSYQCVWRHPIWICWFWMHTDAHPGWQGIMILWNTFTFKCTFNIAYYPLPCCAFTIFILTRSPFKVILENILDIICHCFGLLQ